jgi:hypothetical protein
LDEGKENEPGAFHSLRHKGNLGTLVVISPHHEGPNGHKSWPAGRPSFTASKALSMSIDATKAHDKTLVGGASLNSVIFLAAAVVDKALKGSMAGERMNKSFGREVMGRVWVEGFIKEKIDLFRWNSTV